MCQLATQRQMLIDASIPSSNSRLVDIRLLIGSSLIFVGERLRRAVSESIADTVWDDGVAINRARYQSGGRRSGLSFPVQPY